jgi:Tfp pilus assembly protein FimT
MVVVGLIAMVALITMPRIDDWLQGDVERDVQRVLENLLLAVREEAVLSRTYRAVYYELENGSFGSAILDAGGEPRTDGDSLAIRRKLPKGLKFMDVITASKGKESKTKTFTVIWPNGFIEPTTIHIQDKRGEKHTLFVEPMAGTITLERGYLIRRWVRQ